MTTLLQDNSASPNLDAATPAPPSTEGQLDAARFEQVQEIGKGGMATIYLARDLEKPGKMVAIKAIHSHLSGNKQLVHRFVHEVQAQSKLNHENIVEVLGWGTDEKGRLFMAMEYVDGITLKDLIGMTAKTPIDVTVCVVAQVLAGLTEAHRQGVVHRDIKPANIMITPAGKVKLADFGISKTEGHTELTSAGSVIGTPAYMSPEQAVGRDVDGRSDLFSVGIVLHELLTGESPFDSNNAPTTLNRVVNQAVRPLFETLPYASAQLDAFMDSLLRKLPEKRPESAEAARKELLEISKEDKLAASPTVLASFMAEPDTVDRKLRFRQSTLHHERGMAAYAGGKGSPEGAIWEFFLATLLDPRNKEARAWLEQLSSEQGYNLKRRTSERIDELEASLKKDPDQLHVVLQLAKAHKAQGNFLQVIFYYKRAKSLRPPDKYTQKQIETLVHAHAASVIERTGVFETVDGIPVRTRPAKPEVEEIVFVSTWQEFLAGLMRTGLGKMGASVLVAVAVVLVAGSAFDTASTVGSTEPALPQATDLGPAPEQELLHLQRAEELTRDGEHAQVETVYEGFLEKYPDSPLVGAALFGLGNSLERQGRRDEALEMHGRAAELEDGSTWSMKSLARTAELLELNGDIPGARSAWEAMEYGSEGILHTEALLGLADLDRTTGHVEVAVLSYEGLLEESAGTEFHGRVRLSLAEALIELGEPERATDVYEDLLESIDHLSDEYETAEAALAELREGEE